MKLLGKARQLLREFREELHRSRGEEQPETHNSAQDFMEQMSHSVRISMHIDRRQGTLPPSRNSTRLPLSPVLLHNGAATFTTFNSTNSCAQPAPQILDKVQQPVGKTTIDQECQLVISRGTHHFSDHLSRNHQQQPAEPLNNGQVETTPTALLETDLDTGVLIIITTVSLPLLTSIYIFPPPKKKHFWTQPKIKYMYVRVC